MAAGGKCSLVESRDCEAPSNRPGTVRTRCWKCGEYVCKECSNMVTDAGRVPRLRRWCVRCVEEHRGIHAS